MSTATLFLLLLATSSVSAHFLWGFCGKDTSCYNWLVKTFCGWCWAHPCHWCPDDAEPAGPCDSLPCETSWETCINIDESTFECTCLPYWNGMTEEPDCTEGTGYTPDAIGTNNVEYKIHPDGPMNHEDAFTACLEDCANMAWISNSDETDWLADIANADSSSVWLERKKDPTDETQTYWYHEDCTPTTYDPTTYTADSGADKACFAMLSVAGIVMDIECDTLRKVVCIKFVD